MGTLLETQKPKIKGQKMKTEDPANPSPTPPEKPTAAPETAPVVPPANSPPPAAEIVLTGTKNEREAALERDLKVRESRINELEDENRKLKTPPAPRPQQKKDWLEGGTFFH